MKKLFLTISVLSTLTFSAVAQGERKTTPAGSEAQMTPEQKVDIETTKVTSVLNLSAAQQVTFKKLLLEKITTNQPLKEKAKATTDANEKQKLISQVKANNEKFFSGVNAMLTPEQQPKWADHKKKLEAKQAEKAGNNHQD